MSQWPSRVTAVEELNLADPFGHMWPIHQQLTNPSEADMNKGAAEFYTPSNG